MNTGVLKLRAISFVGVLIFSFYTPVVFSEDAGNVLFGAAAMIGATGTMVGPAIRAAADVNIAQTNAAVSTYTNSLAAMTEAYKTNATTNISMANTLATLQIASMNAQKDLMTTALTTAYQASVNNQNYQLQLMRQQSDSYFRNQDYQLKLMLAQAQMALAQAQSNMALVNQNLSNNMVPVRTLSSQPGQPLFGAGWSQGGQSSLSSLGQVASLNPRLAANENSWRAGGMFQKTASRLAQAFRSAVSMNAIGSNRNNRIKGGDIANFMAAIPANSLAREQSVLPLHQQVQRGIRVGDAHNDVSLSNRNTKVIPSK